jgi:hypothetical protein
VFFDVSNVVKDMIASYSENYGEHMDTVCGQIAEAVNVKACGSY